MNKYILFGGSFLLSLIVSFILEKKFIPYLIRIKMGQTILDIGPRWHKSKEGTPTMGGIFFIASVLVSVLAFGIVCAVREESADIFKVFGLAFLFGGIGFIDDFVKFVKKRNKGLSVMQKLILQFAVSALFLYLMKDSVSTVISVPFTSVTFDLGVFYWAAAIIFIVFMVNSVNLTDGIDGLCAGVSFVVFMFFSVLAVFGTQSLSESKTVLFAAISGGMIGFLIYNYHPARIFMGDTGSLFLGGALCGAAFWVKEPLVIVICGFVFLFEAISVVLQVGSFKLFKKRIFKMAPFHHHLEMCGWKETGIVTFAVILTAAFSVIAYFAF